MGIKLYHQSSRQEQFLVLQLIYRRSERRQQRMLKKKNKKKKTQSAAQVDEDLRHPYLCIYIYMHVPFFSIRHISISFAFGQHVYTLNHVDEILIIW
jgi:hypothetical protein